MGGGIFVYMLLYTHGLSLIHASNVKAPCSVFKHGTVHLVIRWQSCGSSPLPRQGPVTYMSPVEAFVTMIA